MKNKVIGAALIAIALLTGCATTSTNSNSIQTIAPQPIESQSTQTPSSSTTSSSSSSDTSQSSSEASSQEIDDVKLKFITERKVVDGKMQSYLTGEWKDVNVVQRRNFALMVPNNKPAMPQYGISKASIVFEAPMESGECTRLMEIVEDYDGLDHIGPVRSSRDYFLYESMAYDSIYCNWGLAVPYVADLINSDRVDNVSQAVQYISSPSAEAFDRIDRGSGYATEFTGYMFIKGYEKAVTRHGYATQYRDTFEQSFKFADDGYTAKYEGYPTATLIKPGGDAASSGGYQHAKSYFQYNEADGLYYHYQFGSAHIDDMNNEKLAYSNVVFKICHGEVRDDHGYLAFEVHGDGEAYVFTNGKVIHGTWERNSDYEPNLFRDDEGNEIIFNQGKTWVCIIWDKYQDCISYE